MKLGLGSINKHSFIYNCRQKKTHSPNDTDIKRIENSQLSNSNKRYVSSQRDRNPRTP